mmetsp:Transcript_17169/g.34783  ORF Transcript_17169/g.34783 Transcript_17169/m.34783 type:complete len:80 (-) Transcript_17169:1520-1759(-)
MIFSRFGSTNSCTGVFFLKTSDIYQVFEIFTQNFVIAKEFTTDYLVLVNLIHQLLVCDVAQKGNMFLDNTEVQQVKSLL